MSEKEENCILEWVKASGKADAEDSSAYKTLNYCFSIYNILNFASDGNIKTDNLTKPKKEGDWLTAMKNIKALQTAFEKEFNSKNISVSIEATAMARGSKPELLLNFYKIVIIYCYESAHKSDFEAITAKCSQDTQTFVNQTISAFQAKTSDNKQEEKAAPAPKPSSPTKEAEKQTTQTRELSATEKVQLRSIEKENAQYRAELEKLKAELQVIQSQNGVNSASLNAGDNEAQISQQKQKIQQMENESKEIDEELKKLQDITAEKEKEQADLKKAQEQLQNLEDQLRKPLDFEALKQSEDPQIQELLTQIKAAEDQLKPEYTEKLTQDVKKLAETVNKLKNIVTSKKAKAGEAKDEPADGETAQLEKEIEEIVNRNNQLNLEIMSILSRTEAIEQSKNSHSFLEHLRTSDLFLSTH